MPLGVRPLGTSDNASVASWCRIVSSENGWQTGTAGPTVPLLQHFFSWVFLSVAGTSQTEPLLGVFCAMWTMLTGSHCGRDTAGTTLVAKNFAHLCDNLCLVQEGRAEHFFAAGHGQ